MIICLQNFKEIVVINYKKLRDRFKPRGKLRCVIVAESPPKPKGGVYRYFYKTSGRISEPLFSALMKLLNFSPKDKKEGLEYFRQKGLLLVDATYKSVSGENKSVKKKEIKAALPGLVKDLQNIAGKDTPILLIAVLVCGLERQLKALGFNVINAGVSVPFPARSRRNKDNFQKLADGLLRDKMLI